MTSKQIREQILIHLKAEAARTPEKATPYEFWTAVSRTIMQLLADNWAATADRHQAGRQAHYFSAEFLQGRSLLNNLINLDLYDQMKQAVEELGFDLSELEEEETDPALGNGGLGRLASCFLDSCATLNLPVTGYGLLYRFGLFRQTFDNGFQVEQPDAWMEEGYPFLIRREEERVRVHFQDLDVYAVPYDLPVTGYGTANINKIRLWRAQPVEAFDFNLFNNQRFDEANAIRNRVEDITRVLYPNDTTYDGKVLRVRQQYFFTSASLQSIIAGHIKNHGQDFSRLADLHVIQINDTHPAIAIPELIRILTESYGVSWEDAFAAARRIFAYTNHTVLGEALEKWDLSIYQFLFPWLLEIIKRIDAQFRQEANQAGLSPYEIDQLAPIGENKIRMAWLATYVAFSVNGVAAMHTDILKRTVMAGFYRIWPDKFNNKTNGVTPRRWLRLCNPELASMLTELSGNEDWIRDLSKLSELKHLADDENVLRRLVNIKRNNKIRLAKHVADKMGITIDPDSFFDIQVKRLHEYKRQLLNAFFILDQYFLLKDHPDTDLPPCTFIFGAKAAPGYFRAKGIIKLINEIARLVNNDPAVNQRMKVVYINNYNVSHAEKIFPAADASEQISTVGLEASGTGNMKFMLNGALTIGTRDGANVEIADAAGFENCYIFGCKIEDFPATKAYYNSQWQYQNIPGLRRLVDTLIDGTLGDGGSGMFHDLYNSLIYGSNWQPADPYYVLGDFDEYRQTRYRMMHDYRDKSAWARKCWLNITASGRFSSDRTIREYADEIWQVQEQPV
ncbi:MAG: glycogen/starch/alpha-glucan phosphorylase [Saccharofermentanales bacterium]|jgi:starch phosphorylase|nr:glycogen/starch/alpha-glucan phosphorylase [Clostridiaceae bacterium]